MKIIQQKKINDLPKHNEYIFIERIQHSINKGVNMNISKDEAYYFKRCCEVDEQLAQHDLIIESEEV